MSTSSGGSWSSIQPERSVRRTESAHLINLFDSISALDGTRINLQAHKMTVGAPFSGKADHPNPSLRGLQCLDILREPLVCPLFDSAPQILDSA
jgi:hypothetical protein